MGQGNQMPSASAISDTGTAPGARALSPLQRESWERGGYLVLPHFFGADVIDPINELIATLCDPRKRPPELASRVVIDLLSGTGASQRRLLADAPAESLDRPVKFNDLFLECDVVRACNLHPRLVAVLDDLLDGPPAICASLNFIRGSEQVGHVDSWFMPPPADGKMVVTSVCLEDVHPDAGPLFYFPGSHTIAPYRFSTGKLNAVDGEMMQCHEYVHGAIAERGLRRETFIGRKGDVFIWACHLAHGGTPINDPQRTRRSLVTHYWRATDMARHKLNREGPGGYYFAKYHQPIPTSPLWQRVANRANLELRWGLRWLKGAVAGHRS